MKKSDLVALKILLKHAKTTADKKIIIARYPELQGRSIRDCEAFIKINDSVLNSENNIRKQTTRQLRAKFQREKKYLRVGAIEKDLRAQGPGTRYTIWVQGCSIHCKGCSNTDLWDSTKGFRQNIPELAKDILATKGIDGITITGGEPLDQYVGVLTLCKTLFGKICIFLTTGYTMGDLHEKALNEILSFVDIICTGPFEQDKICSGEWKGSSNQFVSFLTDLGASQKNYPKVLKEIKIHTDGTARETGFTA